MRFGWGVPVVTARPFDNICGNGVVLSSGLVLPRRVPLQTYLFGSAKGHEGRRAISKMTKCPFHSIVQCLWYGEGVYALPPDYNRLRPQSDCLFHFDVQGPVHMMWAPEALAGLPT